MEKLKALGCVIRIPRSLALSPTATALSAAVFSALLGIAATQEDGRWLAWVMLTPAFCVSRPAGLRWTCFALLLNSVFLLPYQYALELELVSPTQAILLYLGIVSATVLPFVLLDIVESRLPHSGGSLRTLLLTLAIWLIWLAGDAVLASKYWYALALDPAPLWLVRHTGEEGLALTMIATSAGLALAFRLTGWWHRYTLVALGSLIGWLCLANPLSGQTRVWPAQEVVGIQAGGLAGASDRQATEVKQLIAGMASAVHQQGAPALFILPELETLLLRDDFPPLAPYLQASQRYGAEILLNGAAPSQTPFAYERQSRIVRDGNLQTDAVAKRRLVPYYESIRGPFGQYWVSGAPDSPRLLDSRIGLLAPLLCFEVFDRKALRNLDRPPALIAVAADTEAFGHPAIGRYLMYAAAFQSQHSQTPVILINHIGPSGVIFPNGERVQVFQRGESGFFRINSDGSVQATAFTGSH